MLKCFFFLIPKRNKNTQRGKLSGSKPYFSPPKNVFAKKIFGIKVLPFFGYFFSVWGGGIKKVFFWRIWFDSK